MPGIESRAKLTKGARAEIFSEMQCSAVFRKRPNWKSKMLTVTGPAAGIDEAIRLATLKLAESQKDGNDNNDDEPSPDPEHEAQALTRPPQKTTAMRDIVVPKAAGSSQDGIVYVGAQPKKRPRHAAIKTVEVYVFGLEQIRVDGYAELNEETNKEIEAKFYARFPWVTDINIWSDARRFHVPKSRSPYNHTGEHDVAIQEVVRHSHFGRWISHMKEQIKAHNAKESPHLRIAVFCRMGTNRSVSAARVLVTILARANFVVGNPEYLNEHRWARKGICSTCMRCRRNPLHEPLFQEAIEKWNRV